MLDLTDKTSGQRPHRWTRHPSVAAISNFETHNTIEGMTEMAKRIVSRYILVIALIMILVNLATALSDQEIETGLLNSMRLNVKTLERMGSSGSALKNYMQEGIINQRPNQRADYTDYYLVKKPAKLMGHDLVVIEEEYMSRYVGCCVSPGVGVTVKVAGSTENLEKFANENGCTLTRQVDLQHEIESIGIKTKVPKGNYVSLSCRERDAIHK